MRPFSLGVECSLGVLESLQGQRLRQAWHPVSAELVREHPATSPPSRTATPSFQPGLSVSPDGGSLLGRLLECRVAAGAPCSQAIPSPQPPHAWAAGTPPTGSTPRLCQLCPGVICTYLQARSGSCGLLPPGVSQHQEAFPEFGSTRTGEIRFDTWLLALPSAGNPGVEASDSPACRHPGNRGSTCAARAPRGPRGSWLPRTPP